MRRHPRLRKRGRGRLWRNGLTGVAGRVLGARRALLLATFTMGLMVVASGAGATSGSLDLEPIVGSQDQPSGIPNSSPQAFAVDPGERPVGAAGPVGGEIWTVHDADDSGNVSPSNHNCSAVPDPDTIYTGYRLLDGLGFAKSEDSGLSWSSGQVGSPTAGVTDCAMTVLEDGTIVLAYAEGSDIRIRRSINAGGSFGSAVTVDTGTFRRDLSIDAHENTVVLSYNGSPGPTSGPLRFSKSTNGGANWGSPVTIDASGDANNGRNSSIEMLDSNAIGVSYNDPVAGVMRFANSTDGGANWSSTEVVSSGVSDRTALAYVDAENVYVSWRDSVGTLLFAKSDDGGGTRSTIVADSSPNDTGTGNSMVAIDQALILASHVDSDDSVLKVSFSDDGGDNWIDSIVGGSGSVGGFTSIATIGGDPIFISYFDGDGELKVARSSPPAGGVWDFGNVDSSSDVGSADHNCTAAVGTMTAYVGYRLNDGLGFAKSTDGGATFSTDQIGSSTAGVTDCAITVLDDASIVLAYTTTSAVEVRLSTDEGDSFSSPITVDTGTAGRHVSIDSFGPEVFLSYNGSNPCYTLIPVGPAGFEPTTDRL